MNLRKEAQKTHPILMIILQTPMIGRLPKAGKKQVRARKLVVDIGNGKIKMETYAADGIEKEILLVNQTWGRIGGIVVSQTNIYLQIDNSLEYRMKSSIEDFETGWYGIYLALDEDDIDKLIELLKVLKEDNSYHFHLFSTAFDNEPGGIADIQFSRKMESEPSNLKIGG